MKIVIIKWVDSTGVTSGWEFTEDIKPLKPAICTSVGFLIDDAEDYKTIVQTDGEDQILGRLTIPVCAIKEIKEVKQ